MKTKSINVAPVGTIAHAVDSLPEIEKQIEARLKVWLEKDMAKRQRQMDEWKEKFSADPCFALEWSDSIFEHATSWEVALLVFETIYKRDEGIEFKASFNRVIEWLNKEVLRMARFPSMSTSLTSNLVNLRKAQAYAEMLDKLEWYQKEKEMQ